ncbi:MAG: hypothetical protein AMXMBFR47_35290 [Planctomycetota bacterium]
MGLFGLTAFSSDQTPSAKSSGAQTSPNPISLSASAAGAMQVSKGEKVDPQTAQKAAIIAKNATRGPSGPAPRGTNDDCASAIQIACGDTISGDTTGATTDGAWPCAAGGSEIWYSFTAADPVAIIDLCGSSYDTAVMLLDGCGGAVLGCNDDFCGLQSTLSVSGLTVGNTYLIAVGGFASGTGGFTMTVTCGIPPSCTPAQPGDIEENEPFGGCATDYIDAFNGGCNSNPPAFSPINCGDTVHGESGTFTSFGLGYRDTDWWLVNVGGSGAILSWTVTADFPVLIGFVAQPCPQTAFITGTPVTAPACVEVTSTTACLPPGQYVAFVAPSTFAGVVCGSQYRGTLTCTPCEPPPAPANDNCGSAIQIACGDTVNADTTNSTTDGAWPCAAGGSDIWYSFTAADPVAILDLCASSYDTAVMVLDTCGGTVIGCNDDFCGLQSTLTVSGLTVGNTYLIAVGGFASNQGAFSMTLTCGLPPSCAPAQPGDIEENEPFGGCATDYIDAFNGGCNSNPPAFSPINCGDTVHGESGTFTSFGLGYRDTDWWLFSVGGTGAIVSWTVTADFPVLIGFIAQPCPQTAFITGTPVTAPACVEVTSTTACLPPGDYVAFVAPSSFAGVPCGSQYRGTLTCTPCEPPPAPVNNNCADAIQVNCGDTITGDTTNSTTDGAWPCAAGGSDIWYEYVAAGSDLTLDLCGSSYDTAVMVLDGCGGTVIGCNDDFCGLQSTLTLTGLTIGNTYLIAVGGFASGQGAFTMTLSGCAATGACCVNDSCTVTTQANCVAQGGSYQGDGTNCGTASYVATTCNEPLEDISSTGTDSGIQCDDCGVVVNLPFTFNFFGVGYTSVGIASNGYLNFGGGIITDFSNDPIPSTFTPNNIVCPFWDDFNLNLLTTDAIYYEARTSPDRFIVQWNGVRHFGAATGENTFQAILYSSGDIDFRYGAMDTTFVNTGTIGVENGDGTVGLQLGASPNDPGTSNSCIAITFESTGDPCGQTCLGDLDNDGDRDIADLAILLSQFGSSGGSFTGDIDGDGDVDIGDLAQLLSVFGVPC